MSDLISKFLNKGNQETPKQKSNADRIREKELKAAEKERKKIENEKKFVNLYCKIEKSTHQQLREMSFKQDIQMSTIVNKALNEYFKKENDHL